MDSQSQVKSNLCSMGYFAKTGRLSCEEINSLDLVDFLAAIGHHPKKISRQNYWYFSPMRNENTASFKVNRQINRWYDFGTGQGSTLVDFGIAYYRCTIRELLEILSGPFQTVPRSQAQPVGQTERPAIILDLFPITALELVCYLQKRRIDLIVARTFCQEAIYQIAGRKYYALAFKNSKGGYELRNAYFKGSTTPKASTIVDIGANELYVFEGFFDFLSFHSIYKELPRPANFLVLNSLAFWEANLPFMQRHRKIHLFLDHDPAGIRYSTKAIALSTRFQDESKLYTGHKDLNEWLCHFGQNGP